MAHLTKNKKLKVYVTHATSFEFKKMLYEPLKSSVINLYCDIILPHENDDKVINSKLTIRESDLIIAEVSYPSTGQGIELGWAEVFSIPVVCIYQDGKNYSSSLSVITDQFVLYNNSDELVHKLSYMFEKMREQ